MTTRNIVRGIGVFVTATALALSMSATALAATLSAPTNLDVVGGKYTNDVTPTFTWNKPAGATWYEFLLDDGQWQGLGNVSSYTAPTLPDGWHAFYVRAHNSQGDVSASASIVIEIDTVGPTVPTVSPSTATEDSPVTFSVTPYGEAATTSCQLYVDGRSVGSMTQSGTTFRFTYTFTSSGSFSVYARCTDGDNNSTNGTARTVSVNPSVTETFFVPAISPSSTTEDVATTFSVTPYGTLSALQCRMYVNGDDVGSMTNSSGTFRKVYTFTNDGTYTVYAYCQDARGAWTYGTSRTVSVAHAPTPSQSPTVPAVSPSTAIEDETVTFTVDPWSDERVSWCDLYVNGSNVGAMTRQSDGTFERDYVFANDGSYTVYATCTDASGDSTRGTSRTVTVSHASSPTLTVPMVTPSSTTEDVRTTFTVHPTSSYNITDCWLYVDGARVATMTETSTNIFAAPYTFANDGSYVVYAKCQDSHGDIAYGARRTISVSPVYTANRGSLIKIACPAGATSLNPCKAVYYYGHDGMRHVFPNESVFYTWYTSFNSVVEVSADFMANITIGKNVTYRPGSVLVKFQSLSAVYAVQNPRTLRHYLTPSLVAADYGTSWASKLVSVPDSLYSNYVIGNEIDSVNDYDRDDQYYSVDSIDDIL